MRLEKFKKTFLGQVPQKKERENRSMTTSPGKIRKWQKAIKRIF